MARTLESDHPHSDWLPECAAELRIGDKIIATAHGEGGMLTVSAVRHQGDGPDGTVIIETKPRTHVGELGTMRRVDGPVIKAGKGAVFQRRARKGT